MGARVFGGRRNRAHGRMPRKKPLDKEIENDLIAENQRLKNAINILKRSWNK